MELGWIPVADLPHGYLLPVDLNRSPRCDSHGCLTGYTTVTLRCPVVGLRCCWIPGWGPLRYRSRYAFPNHGVTLGPHPLFADCTLRFTRWTFCVTRYVCSLVYFTVAGGCYVAIYGRLHGWLRCTLFPTLAVIVVGLDLIYGSLDVYRWLDPVVPGAVVDGYPGYLLIYVAPIVALIYVPPPRLLITRFVTPYGVDFDLLLHISLPYALLVTLLNIAPTLCRFRPFFGVDSPRWLRYRFRYHCYYVVVYVTDVYCPGYNVTLLI